MKRFHPSWVAAAAAALLVACSGGGAGDQSVRVAYGKLVTFGDSLSDVGSYNVAPGIVAAMGGGRYTVNTGDAVNWTELLASTAGVDALCPAQTGLNTVQELVGFPPVPEVNHAGCYSYAQGGARVTDPVGPGNVALLALGDPSGALGQLTKPIVEQIARHLATTANGTFEAGDLVTVMAGGNDAIMQDATFKGMLAGGLDVATATAAVNASMQAAGTELAGYIKDQIVAKGAQRVVVVNLPDLSSTPRYLGADADTGTETDDHVTRALIQGLVTKFNDALAEGLTGTEDHVLLVDAYTVSRDQGAHPTQYGLTNVTNYACDVGENGVLKGLPTSLVCSTDTLVTGAGETWFYADEVHPTPYGYKLLAQLVTTEMAKKGWL
ncbi:SGNH/GDSL hydrolase family protein [Ideonella sp.]|uniref:SGNH/GDSL hydrolase family protein n=1 Tax=Ideonella sp. TaxID=1929293 RepID=UPI002B4A8B5F|nr:SGNH/GDSL hydrolase family protein [Ideonella sp.]HJV71812.1 SGNH/GDSL hydrolase family protein [Ideonella sp.]